MKPQPELVEIMSTSPRRPISGTAPVKTIDGEYFDPVLGQNATLLQLRTDELIEENPRLFDRSDTDSNDPDDLVTQIAQAIRNAAQETRYRR